MSQGAYVKSTFDRFICNDDEQKERRFTPMGVDIVLHNEESNFLSRPAGVKEYQKIIGSLNYVAHSSRPDVAFSVNALSRYLQKPRILHLAAAKRILIYLHTTCDLGICYFPSKENNLFAYCDASLVSKDSADGKSTTGYCIFFNNNLVAWKSCRQTVVSLSTMESELNAMSTALIALQQTRDTLSEIGYIVPSYKIYTDSLSAIKYLQSSADIARPRTPHLSLRFHFIRTEVSSGQLQLLHVKSGDQIADILTKALPRPLFESIRDKYLQKPERDLQSG